MSFRSGGGSFVPWQSSIRNSVTERYISSIGGNRYKGGNNATTATVKESERPKSNIPRCLPKKKPSLAPALSKESKSVELVTRCTSPTPPPNSAFLRAKRADMEILVKGERIRKSQMECTDGVTQTDAADKKESKPCSKFRTYGRTYGYHRPTDLPVRAKYADKSPDKSPKSPTSPDKSPKREGDAKTSVEGFQSCQRTMVRRDCLETPRKPFLYTRPSEITAKRVEERSLVGSVEESMSKLKLDSEGDESSLSDSSYDENFPVNDYKSKPDSDKLPPKYPPSPKANRSLRDCMGQEAAKLVNVRSISGSSNSRSNGSSLEDVSQHIPEINNNNNNEVKMKSPPVEFKIRKMDSGEIPWWMDSKKDDDFSAESTEVTPETTAESKFRVDSTYKIRKMDSGEANWWQESSVSDDQKGHAISENIAAATLCRSSAKATSTSAPSNASSSPAHVSSSPVGFKMRKMDSCDIPWWSDADGDARTDSPCSNQVKARSSCGTSPSFAGISASYPCASPDSTDLSHQPSYSNGSRSVEENYRMFDQELHSMLRAGNDRPSGWNSDRNSESGPDFWKNLESESDRDLGKNWRREPVNELENLLLYIGKHTNIDELLGSEIPLPGSAAPPTISDEDSSSFQGSDCEKIDACQVKIHDGSAYTSTIHRRTFGLDDAALQLYKDGDYCSYLDLDSSITEQQEEFEGFQANRKDSIVVRTQLSVRVHMIIEKLMKSEGRELRRALFSLKQIFQEDKDLVHEFVQNDGLDCLIKVGSDVDQNYQNYILRALGQVMLYVDGMNGVMEHNATIQWLYSLVSSKFRLVVRTALKLLLVFVEYVESNCFLLIQAIHAIDTARGLLPWYNIMCLLHDYDATDTELLIYATTLMNKTLNGIPDQDTYYDQIDMIEEQNIESVVRRYMSKQGTDLDLLRQFQIYEAVLMHEDGEDKSTPLRQLDENIRKTLRNRKSMTSLAVHNGERRRSRRHSTGASNPSIYSPRLCTEIATSPEEFRMAKQAVEGAGVTPGLRRRRERADRQRSLLRQQYEQFKSNVVDSSSSEDGMRLPVAETTRVYVNTTVSKLESQNLGDEGSGGDGRGTHCNGDVSPSLKREITVKDITQKLATLHTPDEGSKQSGLRVGEMKGIISKAMEGLAKSQSRCEIKSPTNEMGLVGGREAKIKSETDLHWEELLANSTRPLSLCDLDFTDLNSDDERDVLAPAANTNGAPPPPPPCFAPPPIPNLPKLPLTNKTKKTVKLFWKEVRDDPIVATKLKSKQLIWDEIIPVGVDTQRLEHLFESRTKDIITKKQHELNRNKEIIVLDTKRSNAINIGMTKLPPPRAIKTAILKMDSTVMNREGIEKLLTMLPTEEERSKILEAQAANPDLPLGSAEQFLSTLASISELTARLKLWAFKLNYENIEKEIADPLMDLKQGMEILRMNKTFHAILSTLLSIGIFLNGSEVKGFQIEYLSKVPEVKDTIHKHSLLHHLCHIVMEKFPDSTDLYSEIGAITRASRVDFEDLRCNISKLEEECKASFDYLKAIAKHDGNTAVKLKLSDFLADCAERIIALGKIHRRVLNKFHKFSLWLGIPLHRVPSTRPNDLCRLISEFALEYRTTRERVLQQLEKKANHRERNKTRGKMITEINKFRTQEDRQDAELRQLLGTEQGNGFDNGNGNAVQSGSLPWRRQRKDIARNARENHHTNGHMMGDADNDELLESLVKNATNNAATRTVPRERKRTRNSDRKSMRRTLRNGLTEEERTHLAAYIKSY